MEVGAQLGMQLASMKSSIPVLLVALLLGFPRYWRSRRLSY